MGTSSSMDALRFSHERSDEHQGNKDGKMVQKPTFSPLQSEYKESITKDTEAG